MVLSLAMAGVGLVWAEMTPGRAVRFAGTGRPRRAVRNVCVGCERQRARFRSYGLVTWNRYDTLCLQCFRMQADGLQRRALLAASR